MANNDGGVKFDAINGAQKLRFDLLPAVPLAQVAQVFTHGAVKYGDRNWEKGLAYSRCVAAIFRHLFKWLMREDTDNESGLPHLAHIIANCLFLMQYQLSGNGTDDRSAGCSSEFVKQLFTPISNEGISHDS